jgi:hypothetical protein
VNSYPITLDIDERNRFILRALSTQKLSLTHEHRMDSGQWVGSAWWLTKEQSGQLAHMLLDRAEELEGPPIKRRRRQK